MKINLARMSHEEMISQMSPSLYDLGNLDQDICEYAEEGYFNYPPLLNLNFDSVADPAALLLLDDGFRLYIYVGEAVPSKTIYAIFGRKTISEVANPLESEEVPLRSCRILSS